VQPLPSFESISSLVLRAKSGDREAFAVLVQTFMRPSYLVALSVLGRTVDAEDAAQEGILTAFERIEDCRQPERFAAWLLQIVRNRARNSRERRRHRDVPREDDPPEQVSEPSPNNELILRGALVAALDQLPPVQREIVLLHDLEGWTHAEIAQSVGVSEVMSRQHLFVARRELRALLQEPEAKRERMVDHG
jgi:RNA polymerase sigma-70 factor, ECF subfamily